MDEDLLFRTAYMQDNNVVLMGSKYNNKTKRKLRASPLIDDTNWNYDLRQKGNVCGTIVSGAEGYILSSALNEAGDKFYLIALKNNKASSVFSSDFDGKDTFFLCWIKADDM